MNQELTVIARARARPGREAELEKAYRTVVGPTHKESGCLRYSLHRAVDTPGTYVIIERWRSKQDLDQHFASNYIQTLFKLVPDLVTEPPEILILEHLPQGTSEKDKP